MRNFFGKSFFIILADYAVLPSSLGKQFSQSATVAQFDVDKYCSNLIINILSCAYYSDD